MRAVLLTILLLLSCSGDDQNRICPPGEVKPCPCSGGAGQQGVQTCNPSGESWGPCTGCDGPQKDAMVDAVKDAAVDMKNDLRINKDATVAGDNATVDQLISVDSGQDIAITHDMTIPDANTMEVWTDPTSMLMWQVDPGYLGIYTTPFWAEVMTYCDNLSLDGHSDWRLPTISELRTLVRNCVATQTGGPCQVTDSCLTMDCYDAFPCACPYTASLTYYIPQQLNTGPPYYGDYWSSSTAPDSLDHAWQLNVEKAHLTPQPKTTNYSGVRCVR